MTELVSAAERLYRSWGRCRSDACRERILASIREDPAAAVPLLREITERGKIDARLWVPWVARKTLPPELATAVLLAAVRRERTHDGKDAALQELLPVAPEAAKEFLPQLRSRLRGADWHSVPFAIWTLAYLRDTDAISHLKRLTGREGVPPYVVEKADVAIAILEGRGETVLEAIRQHDHDRMSTLAVGAGIIGTATSRGVLDTCARSAPDAECRITCRRMLLEGFASDPLPDIRERLIAEFGPEHFPEPAPARTFVHDSSFRLIRIEEGLGRDRDIVWEVGGNPPTVPVYRGPFPQLHRLFRGYLNKASLARLRDWRTGVQVFEAESSKRALLEARLEIARLRTTWSDEEDRLRAIRELGSAFHPTTERLTSDAWLSNIDAMLEYAANKRSSAVDTLRESLDHVLPFRRRR